MAGFEKTAKTSRAGKFPPPRRVPRRRSRLGLLTALDAARRPSPPRPQRGPRRRRQPVASVSPETDARASTTWRLQPPSASLVFWRKPRNQPSVAACALDPGVDATAAARSELRSRLPFTAVHRPQHLHGSSPSTLDARVPAIQRPSARSHRTVDNSLITGRIEYSLSSISPLMSALSTHHKRTKRSETREEQRSTKEKNSSK